MSTCHFRNTRESIETKIKTSNVTVPFQFPVSDNYGFGTEINTNKLKYVYHLYVERRQYFSSHVQYSI